MHDEAAAAEQEMYLWSLAPRWKPPDRLCAFTENLGVVAVVEASDDEASFDLHVRVIADQPVSVMLEPIAKTQQLSSRFGLVDPVTGRWFQRVADGTYRILIFGRGLRASSFRGVEKPQNEVVSLREPFAIETVLATAASPGDIALQHWRRLYKDADGNIEVEVLGGGQGSGKLTIAACSKERSDAHSLVRISLDRGTAPYLIPLAWAGEECRGEIVVDDPKAVAPTVEVGLWCFDLGPEDHDSIIRSIAATRRGRTRRTWSEIANHATRNGLDTVSTDIRAALGSGSSIQSAS